ncbi:hypothetical protein ABIB49_000202 [Arthrobacter sp. UYCu512]
MTVIGIVDAGTGLRAAITRRFGAESFGIALISRNQSKLALLAEELNAEGFTGRGYAASVRDPEARTAALEQAAHDLDPIEVPDHSPSPRSTKFRMVCALWDGERSRSSTAVSPPGRTRRLPGRPWLSPAKPRQRLFSTRSSAPKTFTSDS